jgi:hypothetical protein
MSLTTRLPVAHTGVRRKRWYVGFALVAVVILLVLRGGSGGASVAGSERQLRSGFLHPLERAGLSVDVLDACHYDRRSPREPWHLSTTIAVAASVPQVVNVLAAQVVVVDDRDDPRIQQFKGEPSRGWNGVIRASGSQTLVFLVKNNVHTSDDSIGVGWLPVCADETGRSQLNGG